MDESGIKWRGAEQLRPFLVPINQLTPTQGNPRRGDVQEIRGSLRRFGQVRPILTDGEEKVIAGHHLRLAALEEGWTHVAVIPHEFADEAEARAYLLADNRTHDLGPGYDTDLLVDQLQWLQRNSTLEGTGYDSEDLDAALAEMLRQDAEPTPRHRKEPTGVHEVVLMFSAEQHSEFVRDIESIGHLLGTEGLSETVYQMARDYTERL